MTAPANRFARTWWAWLTDYPSTNGRIFASTMLAALYVVVIIACLALNRPLDAEVMEKVQWFLFGMMTADLVQFIGKRKTWQPADETAAPSGRTGAEGITG